MANTENKITFNGITFNDFTDLESLYLLHNFPEGNAKPSIISGSSDRDGFNGGFEGKSFYAQKFLTLEGDIIAANNLQTDPQNQQDRLVLQRALEASLVLPRDPQSATAGFSEITWEDEAGNTYTNQARIVQPIAFSHDNGEATYIRFTFTLELQNIYFDNVIQNQSIIELYQNTNFEVTTDGRQVVLGENTLFLNVYSSITNAGNYDAAPLFIISGPCLNPKVDNLTTGHEFQVNEEINTGEELQLDFENGLIRKKDILGVFTDVSGSVTNESRDVLLQIGENELKISDDIGGTNFSCIVYWSNPLV